MPEPIEPATAIFRSRRAARLAHAPTVLPGLGGHRDPHIATLVQRVELAADQLYAECLRSDVLIGLDQPIDEQVAAIGAHHRRLDAARQDLRDALASLDRHLMQRHVGEPAHA